MADDEKSLATIAELIEKILSSDEVIGRIAQKVAERCRCHEAPKRKTPEEFWKEKLNEAGLKVSKDVPTDKLHEMFPLRGREIQMVVNRIKTSKFEGELTVDDFRGFILEQLGDDVIKDRKARIETGVPRRPMQRRRMYRPAPDCGYVPDIPCLTTRDICDPRVRDVRCPLGDCPPYFRDLDCRHCDVYLDICWPQDLFLAEQQFMMCYPGDICTTFPEFEFTPCYIGEDAPPYCIMKDQYCWPHIDSGQCKLCNQPGDIHCVPCDLFPDIDCGLCIQPGDFCKDIDLQCGSAYYWGDRYDFGCGGYYDPRPEIDPRIRYARRWGRPRYIPRSAMRHYPRRRYYR